MEINVKEEITSLLFDNDGCMENFKRDRYDGAFHSFYGKYLALFDKIKEEYEASSDKAVYIDEIADCFVNAAKKREAETPFRKRRGNFYIDQNFQMTLYALPSLLEYKSEATDSLCSTIIEKWNSQFKQYNLKAGTFAEINSGFKTRLCYITTAVCESIGKNRDCYELNLLKSYRDNYLLNREGGEKLVNEYYDIAPTIVNRINREENSREIYKNIFDMYINPCIGMIEDGKDEECKELYIEMTKNLQERYMIRKEDE